MLFLEIILILFYIALWGGLSLTILYFWDLFATKDEYQKRELTDWQGFLRRGLEQVRLGQSLTQTSLTIVLAGLIGWLFSMLGGAWNDHHSQSWFSHSALWVVIWFFTAESVGKSLRGSAGSGMSDALRDILRDNPVILGLAVFSAASHFAAWGANLSRPGVVPFVWILLHSLAGLGLALYRIRDNYRKEGGENFDVTGAASDEPEFENFDSEFDSGRSEKSQARKKTARPDLDDLDI